MFKVSQPILCGRLLHHMRHSLKQSTAYKIAHGFSNLSACDARPSQIYHELNPHPALSPNPTSNPSETSVEQVHNEAVYRQLLVQGMLAVLLPTEDLDNMSLRTLVGDLIADFILGQAISCKACEGWFMHQAITKVVEVVKAYAEPRGIGEEAGKDSRSRLEKYGLLPARVDVKVSDSSTTRQSRLTALFWTVLQYAYLATVLIRFVIVGLSHARFLPPRSCVAESLAPLSPTRRWPAASALSSPSLKAHTNAARPLLTYRVFGLCSTLMDLSIRKPWLVGGLSLCQLLITDGPGGLGSTDSLLDK